MDYKDTKAAISTVTSICSLFSKTSSKLDEFATYNDSLEEVFENKEQIEVSKFYERLPKPTAIAVEEWLNGKVYHRNPEAE